METMEKWIKLLGKSQDDPALKAALAAAGVKKIPKLDKDDFTVIFDLKGHGMAVVMTDEAYFKKLRDQDIGEGPLILTVVDAYIERKKNRDVYKGKLPYGLAPGMTRNDVRKALGPPASSDEDFPADIWLRDGVRVVAGFTQELKLGHVKVEMLRAS